MNVWNLAVILVYGFLADAGTKMQFGKEESEDRLEPATVARERYGALGSFMPFLDLLEPSEVN